MRATRWARAPWPLTADMVSDPVQPPLSERPTPWFLKLPAKIGAVVFFMVALTTLVGNLLELDEKRRAALAAAAPTGATAVPAGALATGTPAGDAAVPERGTTADDGADADSRAGAHAETESDDHRVMQLRLERIVVATDGTVGTTDWRFAVHADGEPLLVLKRDGLDDSAGRNVVAVSDIASSLRVPAAGAKIEVRGWRGSRLRLPSSDPDATGEGTLSRDGGIATVRVAADDPAGGDFGFVFSATPER